MRLAGHVESVGGKINAWNLVVWKPGGKRGFVLLGIDCRILLKWNVRKENGRAWDWIHVAQDINR